LTTSTVVGVALPGLGPGSDSADPKAEGFVVHLVEDCGDGHDEAPLPLLGIDPGKLFLDVLGLFRFLAVAAAVDADDKRDEVAVRRVRDFLVVLLGLAILERRSPDASWRWLSLGWSAAMRSVG
jgi:hypothetical protein